jgi:hypothetical protein
MSDLCLIKKKEESDLCLMVCLVSHNAISMMRILNGKGPNS